MFGAIFFLDTPQASNEMRQIQERVFFMKFAFWDCFVKVKITSDICMSAPNLKPFEYWIVNNCTMRLRDLQNMGLTWVNTRKYLDNLETDTFAFEAAGVLGLHRRQANVPYAQWRKDMKYKIRCTIVRLEDKEEELEKAEEEEEEEPVTKKKKY